MLSNRSYLLRAFYDWISDSRCTPILVIDATNPKCKIPQDFAEGGEIVFNISPEAVRDLKINYDLLEFKASFSGVIHFITAPIKAILAIYAEENGEGLFFDGEDETGSDEIPLLRGIENMDITPIDEARQQQSVNKKVKPPFLKLVE